MKYPSDETRSSAPAGHAPIIFEAIVRLRCASAVYNRTAIVLAPHVIYLKHDELFTDAIVLERDGQRPREFKVGTFKLAGLQELVVTDRAFTPSPLFDRGSFKYANALMTVEQG